MRVTKCFSFDPITDKEVLDYIEHLPNASLRVRELLRVDLGLSGGDPLVSKIVQGVISNLGTVQLAQVEASVTVQDNKLDIDKQGILDILNMK